MAGELDLDGWIKKAQKSGTVADLLKVMAEFRKQGFNDEDCSKMAKAYMRVMDKVGKNYVAPAADEAQAVGNDGPVWYEKM